jgi:hypothetical protein
MTGVYWLAADPTLERSEIKQFVLVTASEKNFR